MHKSGELSQIGEMMNWNKGFAALYEIKKVDPVSFMDMGSFDFTGGSITKSDDSLIESAELTMKQDVGECWIRIYLKAKQRENGERVALFTGLTCMPERSIDGSRTTFPVECYSVLKPAEDTLARRGYYAPAGASGALLVKELLSVGPAPIVCEKSSPCLLEPIIAEEYDTNLSMAWKIVDAIGWRIRITGDGTIHICPKPESEAAVFDALENDCIEPRISDVEDWFSTPNCFRAVSGDLYAEAKNIDENNLSIRSRKQNRGGTGEIWAQDSAAALNEGESLSEYAARMLKEAQAPARSIRYDRRFRPDVTVSDLVRLHYPRQGIDGVFRVSEQRITLGHGCRISEEVVMA